ncbi:MAG: ROK family transcriptional regulator [Actinomycetota bacterium]
MGDFNRSVILEAIRRSGEGLSRTELAEATGLSAQTVTNITRRLIDENLVAEAGRTITGPGKPRTRLRLEARSRMAIGVHLDPSVITVVLLDLTGAIVRRRSCRTPADDPQRILEAIAGEVSGVLDGVGEDRTAVAGIGVATPGPLDSERGTVIDPPKLNAWHRVPLRDALAEATGFDVALEKDTTAAAVAELWTGEESSMGSFVYIYLGIGIGAAIVMDGDVVRGVSRNVGEIGHVIVAPDGPVCACGQRGCVDVVCTPQAIIERAERAGVLTPGPVDNDAEAIDTRFSELCELADSGDPGARAVLDEAAGHLSVLIAVLTNLLDVDRVVLGGPFWSRVAATYLRVLPDLVDQQSATRVLHRLPVVGTIVGADAGAVGAGCVVLDSELSPRASSLLLDS